jgi:hypothetical protein
MIQADKNTHWARVAEGVLQLSLQAIWSVKLNGFLKKLAALEP